MSGGTLGPYRLDRELGAGGMGTVWKATALDGTAVAIKVVHPHLVEQPGFRERFEREARSGLAIASPNVVRTIACLETESGGKKVPALVLEFVEGRDLAALLTETGHVPEDLVRQVAREIARGLEAVHAAGIVHRDLKPGNVLMTTAGEVKVMDLGLARQASGDDRMSQTGMFLGTAAYAPPEQFFGRKDLDPRSDLYSLGAMLFELTTGRVPFQAEGIGELVRKVLRDKAPRIGALAPQTTPFFEELVATLLEKEPDRRFASAAELGEVLDAGESGDWWAAAAVRLQMETRKPLRRVRVQRETELWGREDDLAELRSLWERARSGKGGVVLLEGEAGIGKTRLVEELLAAIEGEDEAQIVVARHDPSGAATEALAAAFREHLGAEDLEARLRDLLPETPTLVPAFAALLRGGRPPEGAAELTAETLRTLFVHLARNLAREAPLALVVDDLHFATEEGRALFRAVALAVEGHAVLLVGTARPGLPARWVDDIARRENALRYEVKRLDEATVRAALSRHLGATYEAETVAARIASHAGGNPFFVVEALLHLGEQGHLARAADGAWRVTSVPADLALPATVRELVAARLAHLATADRELLEAASCQGPEFDGRLVAETLSRPRMDVLRALGRLELATRLVRAAGTRFAFDHHVVHEVVYAAQRDDVRLRHHRGIADALDARHGAASKDPKDIDGAIAFALCDHCLKGAQEERGVRYLGAALTHLASVALHAPAVALTERALAVPNLLAGAARARALLAVARPTGPLDLLGRRARQEEFAREAVALAEASAEGELRGRAAIALGNVLQWTSRQAESESSYRRALDVAHEFGDRRGEVSALGNLGSVFNSLGRLAEAKDLYARQLAISREIGFERGEAVALGSLGVTLLAEGRFDEARDCQERSLAHARRTGNRTSEAHAAGNLANVLCYEGRLAEAKELYDRQLALCRELGDRGGEAIATGNLANVLVSGGRLDAARGHYERCVALFREIGLRSAEATTLHNLGSLLVDQGEQEMGEARLRSCLALSDEIGHRVLSAQTHLTLGSVLADAGGPQEPREHLVAARDMAVAIEIPGIEVLARCELALLPGGDAADARAALDAHEERLDAGERRGARFLLYRATRDRAHLAEAKRLLDEAVEHAPPESREAMRTSVRVNREIAAACKAEGL